MSFMAKSAGQNLRSVYRVSYMTIYGMIAAHSTLVAYGRIPARILIDAFSLIVVIIWLVIISKLPFLLLPRLT